MLCAVISGGCGGGSDSSSPEQTESLNDDTGSYDPNEEARGNSDRVRDLSTLTDHYTAHDGDILTGTLGSQVLIWVAEGAAITLRDVTINGENWNKNLPVGLSFGREATIILEGTNYVKSVHPNLPAIHVLKGDTLTIKGSGTLTADASGTDSAGIGAGGIGGCGNIVIEGGTITAIGGVTGAGIGGGEFGDCGNIVIKGGTIDATGGYYGAGIGGGKFLGCGNITITKNVTKVTATRGEKAQHSIGAGYRGRCGTITIGGKVGSISDDQYTYPPDKQ